MAEGRPRIPSDIEREIFVEAGHRCCVCGEALPLDRAHIVPWRESKSHSAADLIILCANCHRRADSEGWGQKTLYEYKKRPWITKRSELGPVRTANRLQLSVDILDGFAQVVGWGHVDGVNFTRWEIWLEVYLMPDERIPASIPIHRITGGLEISGQMSDGFEALTLATSYDSPPHILKILHGHQERLKQLIVSSPIPAILVAYGRIPEWSEGAAGQQDAARFILPVAEADYYPLEIFAPLYRIGEGNSARWCLKRDL